MERNVEEFSEARSGKRPKICSQEGLAGNGIDVEKPDPESFARRYQLDVLRKAIEQNTIAYLDTGAGKTLIAIMLIRSYAHLLRKPQNNIAVFMVPTVVLVQQQADVLEMHTDLKVGRYWGSMGVDLWDHRKWEEELTTYEVFVMTPQIFLDNLRHCFFKFEMVRLMIFDECHHTRKKMPYACIMNEFYHRKATENVKSLPRIFGMTASPVLSKGTGPLSCALEVSQLETILNAKVYTLQDTTELESVLAYPDLKINYYDSSEVPSSLLLNLKIKLEHLRYKHTHLKSCEVDEETKGKARRKIGKFCSTLLFCAEEMGIWCAAKASEMLLNPKIVTFEWNPAIKEFISNSTKHFLQDALDACNKCLPADKSWRCGTDLEGDVISGYLSSKVQCLIQSLLEYRDSKQLRCIVFVRRVIAAMVVKSLLSYLECLSVFKSEYMVGHQTKLQTQTQKEQTQIVEEFREGKVNIIVATQVLEEGLDIKGCNLVIRFDLSDNVCSFIQSRGRARMQDSRYVMLVKRGDGLQEKQLDDFHRSEQIMKQAALHRTLMPSDLGVNSMPSIEIYCVESTGAIVSLDSSVALIHYYCSRLPGDRYYTPRPIFHINKEIGECVMELPRNCPVLSVKVQGDISLLKQRACLKACKQLHEVGELTDYLLPERKKEEEDTSGLVKGKEDCDMLYPLYVPNELAGEWDPSMGKVLFHCYYLLFQRDFAYTFPFCNVLLLLRQKLDETVEDMPIQLQTTIGGVTIQPAYAGSLELTSKEVEIARKFQVIIFGLLIDQNLDKLNEGINENLVPTMMYLLVPMINTICRGLESSVIDWTCMRMSVFSETICLFGLAKGENILNEGQVDENWDILETEQTILVHTAFGMLHLEMLQDSIIETPHNGRLYCVTNVLKDLDSNSPLASAEINTAQMRTYIQHFKERHGINIKYPEQPLLGARPLFKAHNFLLMRPGQAKKDSVTSSMVELPPEICKLICRISPSMLYTFSFLPSVMHRIESVLSAASLWKIFSSHWPHKVKIPTFKVLEALTRKKCQECMSLESLETLGDAFLKYVSSRHLFTTYIQQHEGQLTAKRQQVISNYALYKMGYNRQLPGYVRNECFDPKQWIIPGHCMPLSSGFHKDKNLYIKGYRSIKIKNIADVVEALIGACLDAGGEMPALDFIKWLGITIDLAQGAFITNKLDTGFPAVVNIPYLESLLNYSFHNHNLLVEAMTHASYMEPWVCACYQRLEFLGDAVMDYLITLYLYKTYPGLSPGALTDLKSAAVNNDCYAQAAVKWNLQKQLLHASSVLHKQITDFVQINSSSTESRNHFYGWCTTESAVPKVLGDLIESIAGAVLVDSGFDTNIVWTAMKPLLEPIVTPESICYHPIRELQELCQKKSYTFEYIVDKKEGICSAKIEVGVGDATLTEVCDGSNKKTAKKFAAEKMLKSLKASI